MLLKSVKIENFRSLNNIEFEMENYLVVFGKNNEGKSNILKGLERYWDLLDYFVSYEDRYKKETGVILKEGYLRYTLNRKNINLENDIPIEIRALKKSRKTTKIILIFELVEEEIEDLNNQLTSSTKATRYLEVGVEYNKDLVGKVSVRVKEGGNSVSVLKNIFIILKFLKKNFSIDYIPSIRTEEHSVGIVEKIISEQLRALEKTEDFVDAINKINKMQIDLLEDLSELIAPDLNKYVESIKNVEITTSRTNLVRLIRSNYNIIIDDGKKTDLIDKGDGIKSLVALSLLQGTEGKNKLLMIDEPEAHLHSGAIKELELQIKKQSEKQQVLVASHHQLFVNRNDFSNNLILSSGRLKKRTNIKTIREELGVSLGENLINSEYIILVEGETDEKVLKKYIELKSRRLSSLIKENRLIVENLGGTKNLTSRLKFYTDSLCNCICFLDNDNASISKKDEAIKNNLINNNNIYITPLNIDQEEAELEDLFDDKFIFQEIDVFFGVKDSLARKSISKKKKFTDKLVDILNSYGRPFDKSIEEEFKWHLVHQIMEMKNTRFILTDKEIYLDTLIEKIESDFKD